MGRYACYGLFCLAIPVLLTSAAAVDVFVNKISDYNGVRVTYVRLYKSNCIRHQPTDGLLVTRVLIDGAEGPSLTTSAPYLDVLVRGTSKYFKVENSNWSSSSPFHGKKYIYFKVKKDELFPCDGPEYMRIYRHSYRHRLTLDIRQNQGHIDRRMTSEGELSKPKADAFIKEVAAAKLKLWEYEKKKRNIFVKALERRMHGRNVATLYFVDLNDNEIEMDFMLWRKSASYLSPWKGSPKEYGLRSARLPSPCVSPRWAPIPLIVNVAIDIVDTPLLKVRNHKQGERSVCVYIAHPNAYIKRFISPQVRPDFLDDDIFMVAYTESTDYIQFQALQYEGGSNQLLVICSENLQNGIVRVTDASITIYSFPLYLEAEVDERMYTKRDITIGGIESVVYTARPHLAFSQVYDSGVPIFVGRDGTISIDQFILQDSRVYIVVRASNRTAHLRFYRGRDDNEWQRADDEHPDYINF